MASVMATVMVCGWQGENKFLYVKMNQKCYLQHKKSKLILNDKEIIWDIRLYLWLCHILNCDS